ncbi:hypothetical protein Peur_049900 [Populus x canadensis]
MKLTKSGQSSRLLVVESLRRRSEPSTNFLSVVNTPPINFLAMVSANNPQTICKEQSGYLQDSQEYFSSESS